MLQRESDNKTYLKINYILEVYRENKKGSLTNKLSVSTVSIVVLFTNIQANLQPKFVCPILS